MPSVAIVDDHALVLEGLACLLGDCQGWDCSGRFTSGDEFLAGLNAGQRFDVVILDLAMAGRSGVDVLRDLKHNYPAVKVLVVSAAARPEVAARCIREGAKGFLSKFRASETLVDAVAAVYRGVQYLDPELATEAERHLAPGLRQGDSFESLSDREREVLERLARGMGIKEIGVDLHINAKTVSTYRARLLAKLGLSTNAELTAYCLQHGMLQLEVG